MGAPCKHHGQCAAGLCEATSGTCVAPCAIPGGGRGAGCRCQTIGTGFGGNACLCVPEDGNCSGFLAWIWNEGATGPADVLNSPQLPIRVCMATGVCSGPEEVGLRLCPPGRLGSAAGDRTKDVVAADAFDRSG